MTTIILPVTADGARTFTTEINGKNFRFKTYFNRLSGWYVDIYDELEKAIVQGIALNKGIDLMRQYTGNNFGYEVRYETIDGEDGKQPDDLGTNSFPLVTFDVE